MADRVSGHLFMIIIQITCLSRSNEKIAAPSVRGPAGAPGAPGRLQRALRGGPALSSFPGARAPGYFSLALCKQANLLRPKGAQITIVSHTNIRHARPPEAGRGSLPARGLGCGGWGGAARRQAGPRGSARPGPLSLLRPCSFCQRGCSQSLAAGKDTPGDGSFLGPSAENLASSWWGGGFSMI